MSKDKRLIVKQITKGKKKKLLQSRFEVEARRLGISVEEYKDLRKEKWEKGEFDRWLRNQSYSLLYHLSFLSGNEEANYLKIAKRFETLFESDEYKERKAKHQRLLAKQKKKTQTSDLKP